MRNREEVREKEKKEEESVTSVSNTFILQHLSRRAMAGIPVAGVKYGVEGWAEGGGCHTTGDEAGLGAGDGESSGF